MLTKRLLLLLGGALLATACQKKDPISPTEPADPDWIKLEIPTNWGGDEAYSVVGDIDKTLLVATATQLNATSDGGKTWRVLKVFNRSMYGLLLRQDTLFALESMVTRQGERVALVADQFSTNFGQTWMYSINGDYYRLRAISQPFGRIEAAGITYRTHPNTTPIPNSSSQYVIASDLLRTDATGQPQALRLPARHYLNNLHLDGQNRLYVTASGLRFDESASTTASAKSGKSAVLYISRRPLP